jgi:succinyl-CoA synthetase alpha subunit
VLTQSFFVPPAFAADYGSCRCRNKVIIAITEELVADMIKANAYVKKRNARLIGPNCPGIITQVKLK